MASVKRSSKIFCKLKYVTTGKCNNVQQTGPWHYQWVDACTNVWCCLISEICLNTNRVIAVLWFLKTVCIALRLQQPVFIVTFVLLPWWFSPLWVQYIVVPTFFYFVYEEEWSKIISLSPYLYHSTRRNTIMKRSHLFLLN